MNPVETVLLENIGKPGSLFIFPTDVAASRWADHLLQLLHLRSGKGSTIAMEKFIAWDTFKQHSVRSTVQGKKSIPPVLRKMFTSSLIRENAQLCTGMKNAAADSQPVFSSLIRQEWAQQADSFAGWLCEALPQLGVWYRQASGMDISTIAQETAAHTADSFTGDDRDLYILAIRYSQFLEKHGLFEPAWEKPPFDNMGNECFLFFPESLFDFNEYKALLEASDHVTILRAAPDAGKRHEVFFYANARSEITEAALYIRALHNNRDVPWDSISVSIPDAQSYGPYLMREFENRNIPYINRTGKPLAFYPAGGFFKALADCVSGNFSFASLRALLLNRHLPWKDSAIIPQLIGFGIKNNCISSWTEEIDGRQTAVNIWDDAFSHPFGGCNPHIRQFFGELQRRASAMRYAASFSEIRKQYFTFRSVFFDMEQALSETDTILSRCISELMHLAEIEKSYPGVHVPDPYAFFTGYLEEVIYLAQPAASGVTILPYRTAAPAPFDCHIILGASQDQLSIVFSPLAFLPPGKREKLGIGDTDASQAFINLHRFNSRLPAAFFCSEQTFCGYAIPYSTLEADTKPAPRYADKFDGTFAPDLYLQESVFFDSLHIPAAIELHKNQQQGFEAWKERRNRPAAGEINFTEHHPLLDLICRQFCRNEDHADKYSVSATSLALYYRCPLQWLFERVLKPENEEIETSLMAGNITGMVYHAVLNRFLDGLKTTGKTINIQEMESYRSMLAQNIEMVFSSFPRLDVNGKTEMSMLTARLLLAEKKLFHKKLEALLAGFCAYFTGHRVCASESYYTVPRDTYYLSGIVDCILAHNESAVIVDFKTKYTLKRSDYTGDEGLTDFQLILYQHLAENALNMDVHSSLFYSIVDACPQVLFGSIHNTVSGGIIPVKEKDRIIRGDDNYIRIMNEFDKKSAQFAGEIANGTFALHPPHLQQCRECRHHKVCRTMYTICRGKSHGI